jgi:peptide/nickel transport system permease protein
LKFPRNRTLRSFGRFLRNFGENKGALVGSVILSVLVVLSILVPFLTRYSPFALDAQPFLPPSVAHPFGTTDVGRDVWSGVLYGLRTSLQVGLIAAVIGAVLGASVGGVAGYYRGPVDGILMRITELFQVIPTMFLALVVAAAVGASITNIILVIGVTCWTGTARLVRAEFLSLRERPFVEAARGLGAGDFELISSEILPNAAPPLVITTSFNVAFAILLEAGLSFLGLGDPDVPSLGALLNTGLDYFTTAWWISFFPGLFILLAVLSLNLIGDGLNDALNPKQNRDRR